MNDLPEQSEVPKVLATRVAERLFRHEWGKLVSILTNIFGVRHLQLAEDVVQDAILRALDRWPYHGIPENPSAWLMRTAKNLALDALRREQSFREKEADIIRMLDRCEIGHPIPDGPSAGDTIPDELLGLIFACCHPLLPEDQQVALALKVVCGFGNREIARAFLVGEAATAKRLTRARSTLRDANVTFGIPDGPELAPRLSAVLRTLYLLFSEGHSATDGQQIIKQDLCEEAIRVAGLLATHPITDVPETHALLALFCLNAARLPARLREDGQIVRMEAQDRSRWDTTLIQKGMRHLALAAQGDRLSSYHLQAAISACHCLAPDENSTDWTRILSLYDDLMQIAPSPVVLLNRAVAVAKVHGPERAIREIQDAIEKEPLEGYALAHAVLGDLELQRQRPAHAARHFQRAISMTLSTPEQTHLTSLLNGCTAVSRNPQPTIS